MARDTEARTQGYATLSQLGLRVPYPKLGPKLDDGAQRSWPWVSAVVRRGRILEEVEKPAFRGRGLGQVPSLLREHPEGPMAKLHLGT